MAFDKEPGEFTISFIFLASASSLLFILQIYLASRAVVERALDSIGPLRVHYEGVYLTPLTAPNLRRQLLKPKEVPQRVYWIQRPVQTKFSGSDHSAITRISYNCHGRSGAWMFTRKDSISRDRNRPSSAGDSPSKSTAIDRDEKPSYSSIARKQKLKRFVHGQDDAAAAAAVVAGSSHVPQETSSPGRAKSPMKKQLSFAVPEQVDSATTPRSPATNALSRPSFSSPSRMLSMASDDFGMRSFAGDESPGGSSPGLAADVQSTNDLATKGIEEITNLYDDGAVFMETKRTLELLSANAYFIHEVMPSAAESLIEMAARIAKHYSQVFHRKMTDLTIDVIKDKSDNYVLVDISAFRFEDSDIHPFKLSNRAKDMIEDEFQVRSSFISY